MSDATKPQDAARLFSANAADVYDTSNTTWTFVLPALDLSDQDVWSFTCWGDDALKTKEA